jgi:hypothetical protein
MDRYRTRLTTDVLSNIHLSLSSVASSQSARVMLVSKEADLQELAAELKTLTRAAAQDQGIRFTRTAEKVSYV